MGKQALKISLLIILSLAALGLIWFVVKKTGGEEHKPTELAIYIADGCHFCAQVEDYVKTNRLEEKLPIVFKEVSKSQNNAGELVQRAEKCGLDTNRLGVPILYDGRDCYQGDGEINNYLKNAAGL